MQSLPAWKHLPEKNIPAGETRSYFIRRNQEGNIFKVVVTDLVYVWINKSSEEDYLRVLREFNPLIECNTSVIIHKMWGMLDEFLEENEQSTASSLEVNPVDDKLLKLKFRTTMDGIGFKFELLFTKESPIIFFEEVTDSLMSIANELVIRQDALCSLLAKKDLEIAQYKLEGATLIRRNVETKPFIREDFVSLDHSSSNSCNTTCSSKLMRVLTIAKSVANVQCSSPFKVATCVDVDVSSEKQIKKEQLSFPTCPLPENDCNLSVKPEAETMSEVLPNDNASRPAFKSVKRKKPKINL